MKTIVFQGYSGSGKTLAIARLVSELTKAGRKVGTIKSIHDDVLTLDRRGKDTWLHAAAGASFVVALLPNELTTIEKKDTSRIPLRQILGLFERRGVDFLLVEGLHRRLSKRKGVAHIVCARSTKEAAELLRTCPKPLCILIQNRSGTELYRGVPLLHLPGDTKRLVDLVTSCQG